jgi:hypothetical protein
LTNTPKGPSYIERDGEMDIENFKMTWSEEEIRSIIREEIRKFASEQAKAEALRHVWPYIKP